MKKLIFTLIIVCLSALYFSCEKDDCEASITVVNVSSNDYYVYINGDLKAIVGGLKNSTWDYSPGAYTIKVVQKNGYVLTPTQKTYTGNLECGGILQTMFP